MANGKKCNISSRNINMPVAAEHPYSKWVEQIVELDKPTKNKIWGDCTPETNATMIRKILKLYEQFRG